MGPAFKLHSMSVELPSAPATVALRRRRRSDASAKLHRWREKQQTDAVTLLPHAGLLP